MKMNLDVVFCCLFLVSQKAFDQQLLVSENFMVLEEYFGICIVPQC
jgi:hypothetical protein